MKMHSSDEELSDSDDGLSADMEAPRRACYLTGTNPMGNNLQLTSNSGGAASLSSSYSDSDGDHDLELVRSIRKSFSIPTDMEEVVTDKPLCVLPPDSSDADDCDEDYETLRAIQRRFAAYSDDSSAQKPVACDDDSGIQSFDLVEWGGPGPDAASGFQLKSSNFPKSALTFVDAIKKNRSCQKFIRYKMMQIEARMEEIKKLIERVKILKDFHVTCKKRTGRALSLKMDARAQLISGPKLRAKSYRETMTTFPDSMSGEKWSKEEKENLGKGVKQQFQGMLLQRSVELFRLVSWNVHDYHNGNIGHFMLT